ncbi:MAG: SoxR reducing system RseC family protein [Bacteroidales bacterium]|nr:SoxR reducing system RseC family protein [Bacteroidales bacterium]MCF8402898.1 SoxR reducing system RseC family protein [Bacteroidales bacterium]
MKSLTTDATCVTDEIKHAGIIHRIENNIIFVSIVAQSACASCEVKGACNITDLNEEIVEVPAQDNHPFKPGDKVNISMEKSLGTRAVFLGYLLPFILVLTSLIIALFFTSNEGFAGLVSLFILIPYYLVLYKNRDLMKRKFVFRIS